MPVMKNRNPATCAKPQATKSESRKSRKSIAVRKKEIGKSRTLLKRYKQQLTSLSTIERQIAEGIMLGDASLQTQDGGKSYRLKLLQGDKNKEYLEYLFHLSTVFSRWILSPPSPQNRQSKTTVKALKAWRSQTISHEAFNILAKTFLDEKGRKRITPRPCSH